jgi:hypothetical protein
MQWTCKALIRKTQPKRLPRYLGQLGKVHLQPTKSRSSIIWCNTRVITPHYIAQVFPTEARLRSLQWSRQPDIWSKEVCFTSIQTVNYDTAFVIVDVQKSKVHDAWEHTYLYSQKHKRYLVHLDVRHNHTWRMFEHPDDCHRQEWGNNVTNRTIPWAANGACAVRRSVVGLNTNKANLLLKAVGHPPDFTNKLALSLTEIHTLDLSDVAKPKVACYKAMKTE